MDNDTFYYENRKSLVEFQQKASNNFEYILFLITAYAITLPIKFIEKPLIISSCSRLFLIGSTLIWVTSLSLQLYLRFYNEKELYDEIVRYDEGYDKKKKEFQEPRENSYTNLVDKLRNFSFMTFIFGMILYFMFFISNFF